MKIKLESTAIFIYLIIGLLSISGCAMIPNSGGESIDYALASNGATISASNFTPGHDPYTVINGVTSSAGWDEGEGWECKFSRERPRRGGWSRLDPKSVMEFGSAWIEVQFPGARSINKVTIYNLNSEKYPASQYGIREAWLQLWKEHGWITVGEIRDSAVVSMTSLDRKPAGGRMVFRFDHTETEKIRFVVFRSNDTKTIGQGWSNDRKSERSVARVIEIEATGLGDISGGDATDSDDLLEAPDFALESMSGGWVRLSDFKGQPVVVTFWAAWSPESKRQVRELNSLYNQYKDQGLVVIGISVDEGGAERIRPFIQQSNLDYFILLATTSVKSAYGGIGKLPSTFIVNQNGKIHKDFLGYHSKNIIELEIRRLLSQNDQ